MVIFFAIFVFPSFIMSNSKKLFNSNYELINGVNARKRGFLWFQGI